MRGAEKTPDQRAAREPAGTGAQGVADGAATISSGASAAAESDRLTGGEAREEQYKNFLSKNYFLGGEFQLGREEGATVWTRKIWGRSWGC